MEQANALFDDDVWEDLLNFIEEKRVIPIIGPELLKVDTEAGPKLLMEWLAEKLAAKLGVDPEALPKPIALNDVVCSYLTGHGRREEAYTRLRSIMREAAFAPPLPLRQLAEITDFNLYVSTTFDPLLEQAINLVRFGGAANTEVIAYAPNRVADLPVERDDLQRPVVYHLLGQAVRVAHLRHLRRGHAGVRLRAAERAPDPGEALPRAGAQPPARDRQRLLKLAGPALPAHDQAQAPLGPARRGRDPRRQPQHARRAARVVPAAGERADAAVLRRRGVRGRAAPPLDGPPRAGVAPEGMSGAPTRFLPPAREMPENAVFISYAREDLPAVQRLKAGLDAAGDHDLVRPRPAGERRRLRPQDPRQHRPLLLFHPGHLRDDAEAPRGVFPPRVELRRRPHARHGRRGGRSSCPCASTPRPRRRRSPPRSSRRCTSRGCRAASRPRNSRSASSELFDSRRA